MDTSILRSVVYFVKVEKYFEGTRKKVSWRTVGVGGDTKNSRV